MLTSKKKYTAVLFLSVAVLFLLSSCGEKRPEKIESTELQFVTPAAGDTVATIETSMGIIKAVLYPKYAPKAVENFTTLAESGYYNDCTFHRIVKNFLIQGGDPTGAGSGGMSIWGIPFEIEITDLLHNYTGALGMASSSSGNGSQFYIIQTPQNSMTDSMVEKMETAGYRTEVINTYNEVGGVPYLDNGYTVFGQVFEGLDIVDKIASVNTDEREQPKKSITIVSVSISVYEEPSPEA